MRTTDDSRDESDERFYVRLSSASSATISDSRATGRIVDNDPLPSLSIADARADEGGRLSFAVTLSPASGREVRVSYRTSSDTASSSSDYTAASGTLTFPADDTSKTIRVRTTDDSRDESDETFYVRLSGATYATISDDRATGTIRDRDDDPGATLAAAYEWPTRCGTSRNDWTFYGHLSSSRGDDDYFKIVCDDARGTLRAYTTGSTDTYGEIRFGDDGVASRNDDGGASNNFDVTQRWVIGTYYIKVRGYGSGGLYETGSYVLKVEWRPYDAPDRYTSAETLSLTEEKFPRHLTSGSDTDWFKFRIGGSGCSTVTIRSELDSKVRSDFSSDPQMHLYRSPSSGLSIADDNNSGVGSQFQTSVKLRNTNTYYIKVTPYGSHSSSTGPYTLVVTRRASFTCFGLLRGA